MIRGILHRSQQHRRSTPYATSSLRNAGNRRATCLGRMRRSERLFRHQAAVRLRAGWASVGCFSAPLSPRRISTRPPTPNFVKFTRAPMRVTSAPPTQAEPIAEQLSGSVASSSAAPCRPGRPGNTAIRSPGRGLELLRTARPAGWHRQPADRSPMPLNAGGICTIDNSESSLSRRPRVSGTLDYRQHGGPEATPAGGGPAGPGDDQRRPRSMWRSRACGPARETTPTLEGNVDPASPAAPATDHE